MTSRDLVDGWIGTNKDAKCSSQFRFDIGHVEIDRNMQTLSHLAEIYGLRRSSAKIICELHACYSVLRRHGLFKMLHTGWLVASIRSSTYWSKFVSALKSSIIVECAVVCCFWVWVSVSWTVVTFRLRPPSKPGKSVWVSIIVKLVGENGRHKSRMSCRLRETIYISDSRSLRFTSPWATQQDASLPPSLSVYNLFFSLCKLLFFKTPGIFLMSASLVLWFWAKATTPAHVKTKSDITVCLSVD